jgi:nitrate/nitrite transport system ATP-binding protein
MEPKVLLLDEPFGRARRSHPRAPAGLGDADHGVDEAVLLSDRILMMTNGPAACIGEIL